MLRGRVNGGAQFVYSDRTIEWMLTMRVLLRLPLRQTQGFIQSLLGLMRLALAVPGLLDFVASPRPLGGGVAEKAPASTDALGGGFDGLESLW